MDPLEAEQLQEFCDTVKSYLDEGWQIAGGVSHVVFTPSNQDLYFNPLLDDDVSVTRHELIQPIVFIY